MPPKTKTVIQLDSPYSDVPWPQVSPSDQNTILDLLASLLSPIGQYRTVHVIPSKGKRNKKRKRQEAKQDTAQHTQTEVVGPVQLPELSSHILIGLNSITRHLDSQSRSTRPPALCVESPNADRKVDNAIMSPPPHLAAVLTTRSSLTPILTAHIHLLLHTSSLFHANLQPTRLISLPKNSEKPLCNALGVPRVGFIGILHDAPNSSALLDFCVANVPEIHVGEWLRNPTEVYMPVRINAVETAALPQM